jgi:hypothetical protein
MSSPPTIALEFEERVWYEISQGREVNTMTKLEQLTEEVATLTVEEQKLLFERVADLAWRRGLHELSGMYKSRLAKEGRLSDPPEKVMEELRRIREEVASREYPE